MKILLIEDDLFFRKFYVEKLREKGFEIDEASNGEEGLGKMASFKPDIVVLDMIMPVKDGFDFLQDIKNDSKYKKIPILVFSTLGQESDVAKAKQLGATDFVNKSLFDFDKLLMKINSIINKK